MENNGSEEQNVQETLQTVEQVGHLAKDTVNVVKDVTVQNWAGVAKDAYNILTNKAIWKALKIIIIPIIAILLIPAVIGAMLFGVLSAVKDVIIDLVDKIGDLISNIVQWVTNDYWIDIDEVKEYTDPYGNLKTGTIVDQYIDQLESLGISLKSLRLVGDVEDYKEALKDPEKAKIVKKYIAEFVRADIITQNFHRRHGHYSEEQLVSSSTDTPDAENLVDGGVYLNTVELNYEIANKNTFSPIESNEEKFDNARETEEMADFKEAFKFVEYSELVNEVNNINANQKADGTNLTKYSLNPNNGNIAVIKMKKITTTSTTEESYQITAELIEYDYKSMISKYSMPFEFLINLCEITQNPEFVYHVARLARDTNIEIVIPYNLYSEETEILSEIEGEIKYPEEQEGDTPYIPTMTTLASKIDRVKVEEWVPLQPIVQSADTWSFAERNFISQIIIFLDMRYTS